MAQAEPVYAGDQLLPEVAHDLLLRDNSIETYLKCPRRYLYEEVYGLRGRRSAHLKAHRCIQATTPHLHAFINEHGRSPDLTELNALLETAWQDLGPIGIPYEAEYREMAQAQLSNIAQHLCQPGVGIEPRQHVVVDLGVGSVQIRIDRVEYRDGNPVFVLLYTGQPRDDHARRARAILAAWHYEQTCSTSARVELHYPQAGFSKPINYRNGTVNNHIDTIKQALEEISARQFPARPDKQNCPTCPFYLICPI